MRLSRQFVAFVAALLFVPALAFAHAQSGAAQKPKAAGKPAKAATHSTSGIIKSIDGASLVIAKNAKATATETFEINAETSRKGELTVGSRVGIRYTTDGGHNVATAVTVSAKGKSTHLSTSSH